MTTAATSARSGLESRARQSLGTSDKAIYCMVGRALEGRHLGSGLLLDVGCGAGNLWQFVRDRFTRYIGVDAVRYEGFPSEAQFIEVDLDAGLISLPNDHADVVAAVETIEHLENPRLFMRSLVRLTKLGGWVIVTTPNNLSLLSLMTLVVKHRFSAFQDAHYPAHLTPLLEVDLRRMAGECGLQDVEINYSYQGRIVLTPWHYPGTLARLSPRSFSDNLLLIGRKSRE